ncbi:MAG: YbaB/EbfC family nucleoid-associated protein [Acidobacteria bacterium]|nr:YbaB/EbfC family nucleoid-associated protein [Acidobacteriota bacterium]
MKNLQQMVSQVRQFQEQLQKRLSEIVVEASAGGGMVTVKMNGQKQLLALHIDPEAWASNDREMLQDVIVAAVNGATRKVDTELSDQMKQFAGGLPFNLPGLF